MTRRADFLAAAKAASLGRGAVNVQARDRQDGQTLVRLGFTATKRIGGAVERNRAKRRLREAARMVAPLHAGPGRDYVFIARGGTARRDWKLLLADMTQALIRLDDALRASALAGSDASASSSSATPSPP